jgi:autotransporter-associated beta strand protein
VLIGGSYTVSNPIAIANQSTSGTYSIGGNTDANSTFSGAITLNQGLTIVSQAVAANSHAVSITGGISSAGGSQTITFAGPGVVYVGTNGITNGSGTAAVKVTGGIADLAASNTYSGNTTVSGGDLAISGSIASNTVTLDATTFSPTLTLLSATALSSSSNIVVLTGGGTPTITLDLASSGVSPVPTQTVNTFEVGSAYLTPGIYNAGNDPSLFANDPGYEGNLDVTSAGVTPEPSSLGPIGVGSFALLARRRRGKKPLVSSNLGR